jgi:hypothetical protein
MLINDRVSWALSNKHLIMYQHIGDLLAPANLVASCVTKIEAILPYIMGVHGDSAWATHSVSAEAYTWKTCTRVRWALIVSLIAS